MSIQGKKAWTDVIELAVYCADRPDAARRRAADAKKVYIDRQNEYPFEASSNASVRAMRQRYEILAENSEETTVTRCHRSARDTAALGRYHPRMAVRIHVILARASERAVVFRRGPSKRVRMLLWHTKDDEIQPGQWLRGRVYEHRCDLSPQGELLVYFAAKHKPPFGTYTAISRPPYFTALALWPKGDTWGGGGMFESDRNLRLNHHEYHMKLAEGFTLSKHFRVTHWGEHAGRGEDEPLASAILVRNGWTLEGNGRSRIAAPESPVWLDVDPPEIWSRHHPRDPDLKLRRVLTGVKVLNGPWYRFTFDVGHDERDRSTLADADWADFAHDGDLLYAARGCLYRVPWRKKQLVGADTRCVADLVDDSFAPVPPPAWAERWP